MKPVAMTNNAKAIKPKFCPGFPLFSLLDRLAAGEILSQKELTSLIEGRSPELSERLFVLAREKRDAFYGRNVYSRGLIEFTNHCRNDCFYCGIRRGNAKAERYRLTEDEIYACCRNGHELGFRTFVLQGGEDPFYTPKAVANLVRRITSDFPDCAVTLSLGERSKKVYELWREAGAERYLLRHETFNADHYASLHPKAMSRDNRIRCLYDLKDLEYQVGCGFMVGSPGQTAAHLAEDLAFIRDFSPQMAGIGPFIPHKDTPLAGLPSGTLELTLFLLGLIRLLVPQILLPATTALGTIASNGRELGVLAGANVVMPNLSPVAVRAKYLLYDDKICLGDEAAECRHCLDRRLKKIGHSLIVHRGDCAGFKAAPPPVPTIPMAISSR
jgi:biotin synthase